MILEFSKYQGTGNDFIIVDSWEKEIDLSADQIAWLCNRKFGIGADGLMILKKNNLADFEMIYFNADGLPGSMCGNGGRCLVQFARSKKIIGEHTSFIAVDGMHQAKVHSNDEWISLHMGDVSEINARAGGDCFVNTGSPHIVRWVDDPSLVDVIHEGRSIRYNLEFIANGTNVNFVKVDQGELYVRTYERGVEDETLSCGTGVTASVLAAAFTNRLPKSADGANVSTPGGALHVKYKSHDGLFTDVWLEGPAKFVYKGEVELI